MPLWRSLCATTRVESSAAGARLNCSVKNYGFPVGFINEHPYGVYTKTKNVEMPFWRSLCAPTRVESMATGARLKQRAKLLDRVLACWRYRKFWKLSVTSQVAWCLNVGIAEVWWNNKNLSLAWTLGNNIFVTWEQIESIALLTCVTKCL